MNTIWTYSNVVLGLIYDEWRQGSGRGLSAWEISRKLRSIGLEGSLDHINRALREHVHSRQLMIFENTIVPFRFVLTEEGVVVAQKVQRELELFKQKHLVTHT